MRPHKPFDTVTKDLIEADPFAWLKLLGLPGEAVRMEDTNLTTLTAEADRVMWVTHTPPYVANLELQASHKDDGDRKVFRYAALLHYKYCVEIESVVLLLRPEAEGAGFTGRLHYRAPGSEVTFQYRLVRVWELPVETLLTGALATLPLAPISDVRSEELPRVIARMKARVVAKPQWNDPVELWTTVALLMGLRYRPGAIRELLKGVSELEESTIYQEILGKGQEIGRVKGREEGRAEEALALLLRMGSKRFGAPDDRVRATLEAVVSLDMLEVLADRLLEVETWQELLA